MASSAAFRPGSGRTDVARARRWIASFTAFTDADLR
jgi:hypothetical protein